MLNVSLYYVFQAGTGRGVSASAAGAHEGSPRPVPSERHRVPRGVREAGGRAARLRHLRRGPAGRVDGAVVLRRHVLHADAAGVPAQGLRHLPGAAADGGGGGARLQALRGDPAGERGVALAVHQAGLHARLPHRARRHAPPLTR